MTSDEPLRDRRVVTDALAVVLSPDGGVAA